MAAFNLTVQLQLQAPGNLGAVGRQIAAGLGSISVPVHLNAPTTGHQALQQAQRQAAAAATAATTASAALNRMTGSAALATRQIDAMNRAATGMGRSLQSMARTSQANASYFQRFGAAVSDITQRFAAFVVSATSFLLITRGFREGVGHAIEFERSMNKIAQVSGESDRAVAGIAVRITELSTKFGVSSEEMAKAALVLAQTGLSAKQVAENLETLALATTAPNFESMAQTAEGMIAVMRQFKLDSAGVKEAIGSMNEVAAKFAVEASDLVTTVRKTGGAFAAAGGDVQELLALFTSVRSTTRESAEEISTGLRTVLARMQRADVVEQLKALNVELRYTTEEARAVGQADLANQFVKPYEAVRRLSEAIKDIPATDPRFASVIESLGGYRQISRVIPLLQQFATAEKALAVAQTGSFSLYRSAEKAQETLYLQAVKTREEFLKLFRAVSETPAFQSFTRSVLSLANALAYVLDIAKPLLPVLMGFATVQIAKSLFGFVSQTIAGPSVIQPKKFATGGKVDGPYGGGDVVQARLTPGEFVVREPSVRRIERQYGSGIWDHINTRGELPRFEAGGPAPTFGSRMRGLAGQALMGIMGLVGGSPTMDQAEFIARQQEDQRRATAAMVALPAPVPIMGRFNNGGIIPRYEGGGPRVSKNSVLVPSLFTQKSNNLILNSIKKEAVDYGYLDPAQFPFDPAAPSLAQLRGRFKKFNNDPQYPYNIPSIHGMFEDQDVGGIVNEIRRGEEINLRYWLKGIGDKQNLNLSNLIQPYNDNQPWSGLSFGHNETFLDNPLNRRLNSADRLRYVRPSFTKTLAIAPHGGIATNDDFDKPFVRMPSISLRPDVTLNQSGDFASAQRSLMRGVSYNLAMESSGQYIPGQFPLSLNTASFQHRLYRKYLYPESHKAIEKKLSGLGLLNQKIQAESGLFDYLLTGKMDYYNQNTGQIDYADPRGFVHQLPNLKLRGTDDRHRSYLRKVMTHRDSLLAQVREIIGPAFPKPVASPGKIGDESLLGNNNELEVFQTGGLISRYSSGGQAGRTWAQWLQGLAFQGVMGLGSLLGGTGVEDQAELVEKQRLAETQPKSVLAEGLRKKRGGTRYEDGGKLGSLPRYESGGISAEDTELALVTPGEVIVNRESVEKIGAHNLHWMNRFGELPPNLVEKAAKNGIKGYNKGGMVGRRYNDGGLHAGGPPPFDVNDTDSVMAWLNKQKGRLNNSHLQQIDRAITGKDDAQALTKLVKLQGGRPDQVLRIMQLLQQRQQKPEEFNKLVAETADKKLAAKKAATSTAQAPQAGEPATATPASKFSDDPVTLRQQVQGLTKVTKKTLRELGLEHYKRESGKALPVTGKQGDASKVIPHILAAIQHRADKPEEVAAMIEQNRLVAEAKAQDRAAKLAKPASTEQLDHLTGNLDKYERMVRKKVGGMMRSYGIRHIAGKDADDVAQDAFIKAVETFKKGGFDPSRIKGDQKDPVGAFVGGIARQVLLGTIRKQFTPTDEVLKDSAGNAVMYKGKDGTMKVRKRWVPKQQIVGGDAVLDVSEEARQDRTASIRAHQDQVAQAKARAKALAKGEKLPDTGPSTVVTPLELDPGSEQEREVAQAQARADAQARAEDEARVRQRQAAIKRQAAEAAAREAQAQTAKRAGGPAPGPITARILAKVKKPQETPPVPPLASGGSSNQPPQPPQAPPAAPPPPPEPDPRANVPPFVGPPLPPQPSRFASSLGSLPVKAVMPPQPFVGPPLPPQPSRFASSLGSLPVKARVGPTPEQEALDNQLKAAYKPGYKERIKKQVATTMLNILDPTPSLNEFPLADLPATPANVQSFPLIPHPQLHSGVNPTSLADELAAQPPLAQPLVQPPAQDRPAKVIRNRPRGGGRAGKFEPKVGVHGGSRWDDLRYKTNTGNTDDASFLWRTLRKSGVSEGKRLSRSQVTRDFFNRNFLTKDEAPPPPSTPPADPARIPPPKTGPRIPSPSFPGPTPEQKALNARLIEEYKPNYQKRIEEREARGVFPEDRKVAKIPGKMMPDSNQKEMEGYARQNAKRSRKAGEYLPLSDITDTYGKGDEEVTVRQTRKRLPPLNPRRTVLRKPARKTGLEFDLPVLPEDDAGILPQDDSWMDPLPPPKKPTTAPPTPPTPVPPVPPVPPTPPAPLPVPPTALPVDADYRHILGPQLVREKGRLVIRQVATLPAVGPDERRLNRQRRDQFIGPADRSVMSVGDSVRRTIAGRLPGDISQKALGRLQQEADTMVPVLQEAVRSESADVKKLKAGAKQYQEAKKRLAAERAQIVRDILAAGGVAPVGKDGGYSKSQAKGAVGRKDKVAFERMLRHNQLLEQERAAEELSGEMSQAAEAAKREAGYKGLAGKRYAARKDLAQNVPIMAPGVFGLRQDLSEVSRQKGLDKRALSGHEEDLKQSQAKLAMLMAAPSTPPTMLAAEQARVAKLQGLVTGGQGDVARAEARQKALQKDIKYRQANQRAAGTKDYYSDANAAQRAAEAKKNMEAAQLNWQRVGPDKGFVGPLTPAQAAAKKKVEEAGREYGQRRREQQAINQTNAQTREIDRELQPIREQKNLVRRQAAAGVLPPANPTAVDYKGDPVDNVARHKQEVKSRLSNATRQRGLENTGATLKQTLLAQIEAGQVNSKTLELARKTLSPAEFATIAKRAEMAGVPLTSQQQSDLNAQSDAAYNNRKKVLQAGPPKPVLNPVFSVPSGPVDMRGNPVAPLPPGPADPLVQPSPTSGNKLPKPPKPKPDASLNLFEVADKRAQADYTKREQDARAQSGGQISQRTSDEIRNTATGRAFDRTQRELVSAQTELLRKMNPQLKASEARRMAEEQVAAELNKQAKYLRDVKEAEARGDKRPVAKPELRNVARDAAGNVLGFADTAAQATADGVRPPGAGGGFRIWDRVKQGYQSVSDWDKKMQAGMAARGMNPMMMGFGFSMMAPYLGQAFQGNAETAVSTGRESSYTAGSTVSGALQGAAVGAMMGVYSPMPVIGMAVGASVGALVGGFTSFRESVRELSQIKLDRAVSMLGDRLQVLVANADNPSLDYSRQTSIYIDRAQQEAQNNAYAQSGYISLDSAKYSAELDKNYRQSFGPLQSLMNQRMQGEISRLMKTDSAYDEKGELDINKLFKSIGGNNELKKITERLAEQKNLTVPEVLDEQRPFVASQWRRMQIDKSNKEAERAQMNNMASFSQMANAAQSVSDSLRELRNVARAAAESFEMNYTAPSRVDINPDLLNNIGKDNPETERLLEFFNNNGGETGQALYRTANAVNVVREQLPNALVTAARTPYKEDAEGEADFRTKVQQLMEKALGDKSKDPAYQRTMSIALSQIDQMMTGDRRLQGVLQSVAEDPTVVARRATDPALGPVVENSRRFLETTLGITNEFTDRLSQNRRGSEVIRAGRDRISEQEVGLVRTRAEFEGENTFRRRGAIEALTFGQLTEGFTKKQAQLAQDAGIKGDGLSPSLFKDAYTDRVKRIVELTEDQRKASIAGDPKKIIDITRDLELMKGQANAAANGLRSLAESSVRLHAAQEKLAQIRADSEGRLGFMERYLSSGPEQRLEMQRGLLLSHQAASREKPSLDGFVPEDQALIIQTMRSMGGSQLTGFPGSPIASDKLEEMIRNTMGGVAKLAPGRQEAAESLQEQVLIEQKRAIEAQTAVVDLQKAANDKLIGDLDRFFQTFFSRVQAVFARGELQTKETELNAANIGLDRRKPLVDAKKTLEGYGITDDARLGEIRTNATPLREYSNTQIEINRMISNYEAAVQEIEAAPKETFDAKDFSKNTKELLGKFDLKSEVGSIISSVNDPSTLGTMFGAGLIRRGNQQDALSVTLKTRIANLKKMNEGTLSPDTNANNSGVRYSDFLPFMGQAGIFSAPEATVRGAPAFFNWAGGWDSGVDSRAGNLIKTRDAAKEKVQFTRPELFQELAPALGAKKDANALFGALKQFTDSNETFASLDKKIKETTAEIERLNASIRQLRREIAEPRLAQERKQAQAAAMTFGNAFMPMPGIGVAAGALAPGVMPGMTIVPGLASGGSVGQHPGSPRGTDTVPAWLTPSEFVVNAQSATANRELLTAINNARGPVYLANGGFPWEGAEEAIDFDRIAMINRGDFPGLLNRLNAPQDALENFMGAWKNAASAPFGFVHGSQKGVPAGLAPKGVLPGKGISGALAPKNKVFDNEILIRAAMDPFGPAGQRVRGEQLRPGDLARQNAAYDMDLLRRRQLTAQSQNPFANFGLGQADSQAGAALTDRAIQGRQAGISRAIGRNPFAKAARSQFIRDNNRKNKFNHPTLMGEFVNRVPAFGAFFAEGGFVPAYLAQGGLPGPDNIPAYLSAGEFVLPKKSVDYHGLDRVQRFAQGGEVEQGRGGGIQAPAGQTGPGMSPQVLQAMEQFGAVVEGIKAGLTEGAAILKTSLMGFSSAAAELAKALSSFSGTLQVSGTQRVELVLVGADILKSIEGSLQKMVAEMVRNQLIRLMKLNAPDISIE